MDGESDKQPSAARLAPERAFVVQLRSDSDLAQRQVHGRVEHIVSGESEPFASLDALLAFMNRRIRESEGLSGRSETSRYVKSPVYAGYPPIRDEQRPRTTLEPEAAFVVQLRGEGNPDAGHLCGRIEHIVSGDSRPFSSVQELLGFMAQYVPARRRD